ncbi:unnamed protein product [Callosobruchus maculatus]|uniref:Uncharacterized protein n=2 Tax=Callosobruchus maculatus TaxID=64391 RepID=A0A653DP83_CALMS|nr:unnamed protein product [Callosobruchus maculatus]
MTEFQIFKTILKNGTEKQFDYPKLQKDSVEAIADTFSNIIYETLKQKSSASSAKRGNVLKFINKLCAVKSPHIENSAATPYLQVAKKVYLISTDCEGVESLQNDIKNELENISGLKENIQRYFKRKNDIQCNIGTRIECIKHLDQEKLKHKYHLQPRKGIARFEVTGAVVHKVTDNLCKSHRSNSSELNTESLDFREKQVKFGYAWRNLSEDKAMIEKVLLKLAKYERLEEFEENFIYTIWRLDGKEFLHYMNIIIEHFYFIIERIIIEQCCKIVAMNDQEAETYWTDLQKVEDFTKIKMVCSEVPLIKFKLHSLINELYILSFCNETLWKLHTFI